MTYKANGANGTSAVTAADTSPCTHEKALALKYQEALTKTCVPIVLMVSDANAQSWIYRDRKMTLTTYFKAGAFGQLLDQMQALANSIGFGPQIHALNAEMLAQQEAENARTSTLSWAEMMEN